VWVKTLEEVTREEDEDKQEDNIRKLSYCLLHCLQSSTVQIITPHHSKWLCPDDLCLVVSIFNDVKAISNSVLTENWQL
jgi:hypothetical protein